MRDTTSEQTERDPLHTRGPAARPSATASSIAYVLKGFPRLSELFVASEIHRLERAGLQLRLFVINRPDESVRHPVVDRIRARPVYLPPVGSVSAVSLRRWLAQHLEPFLPALRRVARRRPVGLTRAAAAALTQAVRARRTFWSWPRKVYVKELLQAVALADRLIEAPDVRHLHAHFCHGATTVTWLAAIITGLPFSFTAHAKDLYAPSLNPAGLLRRKLAAARFGVTCTEANRAHLRLLAGPTEVHRVYHGLNADLSQIVAERPWRPPTANGMLNILAIGRLVPKKGLDVLIDACASLARRGIRFEAVIVGEDGEHASEVRRRIAAHGLERRVTLKEPMDQAALYREYCRATVFCLPCRVVEDGDRDGIPNVLLEAMACGLPVVTTGISGIPELVTDGVTGLIVPAGDPDATADALLRLHEDKALARRLSRAGEALVRERFDGDRLAGDLARLFRQVVA
jgi:glycosyltransferase involved in cell wall biosynthesis